MAERAQKSDAPRPRGAAARLRRHVRRPVIERAALAAIAAAVSPQPPAPMQPASYGDVTVRPIAQKPSLFPEHEASRVEAHEPATPDAFIPQPAERTPVRAPRMPKFEELPMPAQNEIRQARGETAEEHPQKVRMSLLQRLANVGLGRRDEEHRAADRGPRFRSGDAADAAAAGAQAAALGRRADGPTTGLRVRPPAGAPGP